MRACEATLINGVILSQQIGNEAPFHFTEALIRKWPKVCDVYDKCTSSAIEDRPDAQTLADFLLQVEDPSDKMIEASELTSGESNESTYRRLPTWVPSLKSGSSKHCVVQ